MADPQKNHISLFKELLKQISIRELNEKIQFYKHSVDLRTISDENLSKALNKLFSARLNDEDVAFFLKSDIYTHEHEHHYFYRVRKFEKSDYLGLTSKVFPSMLTECDVWTKPNHLVNNYGRINSPNNSMLYAASQATNAIYETECKMGESFFLIMYQNRKRLRVSQIHGQPYMTEFTQDENAKIIILQNFLLSEFTKYVPSGSEYQYKSSLAIYKQFFYSPLIDGFSYPSIKTKPNIGYNICFDQKQAQTALKFLGVMVCKLLPPKGENEFTIELYYDGFLNSHNNIEFHSHDSATSKEQFGDFIMTRQMGL